MQPRDLDALAREIGQPIDALGLLNHALRHRTTDGESDLILDEMELGLSQLRRRLGSFFDVVRTERYLAGLDQRPVPLMPVFQKLALQTGRMAHDNRVSLSVMPTSARVVSDPEALEVILRNLVVNGLFFAPGGRVLLGCRNRGDVVDVQVWDNGIGIPPENRDIIFEPLQKFGSDENGRMPGLGFGLTLVRDLAQGLGHRLSVSSEPSSGSVFSLALPRASG